MAGTSWPALVAGRKAKASEVESKFDWLEGSLVPMASGASTDAAFSLGTTSAQWSDLFVSNDVFIAGKSVKKQIILYSVIFGS